MSLVIRTARREDAPQIVDFIKALAAYEKLADEVVATVSDVESTLFAEAPRAFALIAEYDGAPCGFALYFYNYSTFLGRHGVYLEDLFVLDAFRGKGAGKALLASLASITVAENCGRLEWSVLDWNTPAIDFYKSIGAQSMDGWTINRLTGVELEQLADAAPVVAGAQ